MVQVLTKTRTMNVYKREMIKRMEPSVSVVDLRKTVKDNADYLISTDDLVQWEKDHGRKLDPLILLWTGWGSRWPDRESYLGSSSLNDTSHLRFPGEKHIKLHNGMGSDNCCFFLLRFEPGRCAVVSG